MARGTAFFASPLAQRSAENLGDVNISKGTSSLKVLSPPPDISRVAGKATVAKVSDQLMEAADCPSRERCDTLISKEKK
jgi:hypothetical protein